MLLLLTTLALAAPPDEADATIVVDEPVRDPSLGSAVVSSVVVDERVADGADVATAVDVAPGTTVRRLGGLGDASGVSLRGGGLRQTVVLLDGVPLNPDGGAAFNLSELPLAAFASVDVYRGSAPVELSAGAMGGVVDLRSRADAPPSLYASYGSFGAARVGALASWRGAERARGLLVVDALRSEGDFVWFDDAATRYNTDDDALRTRSNNAMQQLSAHGTARVELDGSELRFLVSGGRSVEGVPGPAGGLFRALELGLSRGLVSAEWLRRGQRGSTAVRLWGSGRWEALRDPEDELSVAGVAGVQRYDSAGVRVVGQQSPSARLAWALVGDARRDAAVGEQRAVVRLSAAGHWRPSDALRVDATLAAAGLFAAQTQLAPTPTLGVRWELSPSLALRAQVARTLRPPDLLELYGNRGAVRGNPDLLAERGSHLDLGLVARRDDDLHGELTAFAVRRSDGIVYIQNAQRTALPINLDDTLVAGVEGLGSLRAGRLDLRATVALTHSDNRSDLPAYAGKRLPRTPAVVWEQSTGVTVGSLRVAHQLVASSRSYLDAANQAPNPGRVLHGLTARYRFDGGLSLELTVDNLLDQITGPVLRNPLGDDDTRVDTALADFTGYPLPGRSVLGTLRWTPTSGAERGDGG